MLNSRSLYRALATVGLLALGSASSFAQTCAGGQISSTNLGLRPEGTAELVGNLSVSCNNNLPTDFTVLVQFPTNVAVVNSSSAGSARGAYLSLTGTTTDQSQGVVSGVLSNAINFTVTGATATGFSIAGIRVNANTAAASGVSSVAATIIISVGNQFLSISGNPALVGTILTKSVAMTLVGGTDATATSNIGARSLPNCASTGAVAGFLRFQESFAGVLRTLAQESAVTANGATTRNANTGTYIRITFANVPSGVVIWMPRTVFTTGNTQLTLVSGVSSASEPTSNFSKSGTVATGDTSLTATFGVAGSEVLYEVTGANQATVDTLAIPFIVRFTGSPTIGVGSATARGGLGPVSTDSVAPRFADNGDSVTAFTTTVCSTSLLYPYITTAGGFDTGIAISNTTADPTAFGTPNQSGTCTITPFGTYDSGATVPAAGTTPTINAGTTWAASMTDSAVFGSGARLGAGFSGYLIAQCNFQLAHGYAFISDYGARNLAQGYLALVLNINAGSRTAAVGTGNETLGN